ASNISGKSQLLVCGAPISMYLRSFGNEPTTRQPMIFRIIVATSCNSCLKIGTRKSVLDAGIVIILQQRNSR
ncbi:MAG TPA: hypothetical protein VFM32_07725, partial [Spongiibacteraceae bacterium]|nr:hypothetical protein [Spongiibacteraceae bacterium]